MVRGISLRSSDLEWRLDRTMVECASSLIGMVALIAIAAGVGQEDPLVAALPGNTTERAAAVQAGPAGARATATHRDVLAGGYLGVTHTHPSIVTIKNPGRTDMTVGPIAWEGKPFKSPIYYGARISSWPAHSPIGTMLDFTHAKAISRFEDTANFSGTLEGKPLPPQARLGDMFKHLEFSHGHNMLTGNVLMRLGNFRVQPYVGAGAGISLPHTEIAFRGENGRTYEYQYAGLAGQVLAGLEVKLGGASLFVEYKLSYAPYDVPLSGVVNGWLLFTDLWRQFRAWVAREVPPGGRLTTPLLSHHAIGGAMIKVTRPAMASPQ